MSRRATSRGRLSACPVTALATAASAGRAAPLQTGWSDSARVEVVHEWPFQLEAVRLRHHEQCAALGKEGIRVSENDRPVQILAVERAEPPALHVLMPDTSANMTDRGRTVSRRRGRQTRAAARAYVDWMPEDGTARGTEAVEMEAPGQGRGGVCAVGVDGLRIVPACFELQGEPAIGLEQALRAAGLPPCPTGSSPGIAASR